MKLTLKDIINTSKIIEEIELNHTIETLMEKAKKIYGYYNEVKLIYCGRVLDKEKLISDYFTPLKI